MNVKDTTMLKHHAVVTLHRNEDTHKLYLNPGAYVEACCASYVKEGWNVFSVELCSRENYLNYRVNDVVDSYDDACRERNRLHDEFRSKRIDFETYMTSRSVINELIEGNLRKLYHLVNRLLWEDLNCYNEEAHYLYNRMF